MSWNTDTWQEWERKQRLKREGEDRGQWLMILAVLILAVLFFTIPWSLEGLFLTVFIGTYVCVGIVALFTKKGGN